MAEEESKEEPTEKPKESGSFGGPVLKVTRINDVFGLMVGGQGGWIYKAYIRNWGRLLRLAQRHRGRGV